MKILLINPIIYDSIESFIEDSKTRKINSDECLSLGYISSYVKQQLSEVEVEIFDWHLECLKDYIIFSEKDKNIKNYWNENNLFFILRSKIVNYKPDLIGISGMYEYSSQPFLETLKIIKEVDKNIITVCGGLYATTFKKELESNELIDYIIEGEGEISFKNLIYEKMNYKPTNFGVQKKLGYIQNLDDLPLPDRVNIGEYSIYGRTCIDRYYKPNCRVATVMISRGCPFSCTYCSGHQVTNRDYRHRNIDKIIEEIKYLKENHGIEVFLFNEENAVVDRNWTKELYRALIPLKIKWISNGGFYVNLMDKELCQLAIDSGIIFFNLAIESGSKRIQKLTKKTEKIVDKAPQIVKWIREINPEIYIVGFLMAGFPFETIEDIQTSIDFAKSLNLNWMQWNIVQIFKGSELYNYCLENDHLDNQDNKINHYLTGRVKNSIVDKEILNKMVYDSNLEINFANNYDIKHGYYERALRDMEHVYNITNGKHKLAGENIKLIKKKLNGNK